MKKLFLGVMTGITIISLSCNKKDDDTNKADDCEKNNYSVLQLNFGSGTVRHGTLITKRTSTDARDKTTEIGQKSDTVHLAPGDYFVNIASIDADGNALEDVTKNISITASCQEIPISVTF